MVVAGVDMFVYIFFASLYCTLSRMLLCIAVVYNWPCSWLIAFVSSIILTMSHQAGGQELLLCALVMALLRYASVRMVNTAFSHRVLIGIGYGLIEALSYLTIISVTAGELGGHALVVIILFFVYIMSTG